MRRFIEEFWLDFAVLTFAAIAVASVVCWASFILTGAASIGGMLAG